MSSKSFFIASSSEGHSFVDEISSVIESVGGEAIDWEDYFHPGDFILEKLLGAASRVSMAVIVVTPDDMLESRQEMHLSPRDNIILEIGLFAGCLGLRNVAVVVCPNPDGKSPKLPSDLAGMIFLSFDASNPARSRVALKRQFTQMIERSENWRVFNELRSALEANREHLAGIENDLSEKYILNKFREIANHARTREVIVQPDEYFSELYRAIDAAGNGTSVLAVSSFSPKVWSEHPDQQIYLEKNLEAAKRGANIRRIFLQSDSDVFKISAEIGRQLRGNISIRRAPHHLSHLSAGVADFVIFKDDQTGTGRVFIADPSPLNPAQIRRGRIVQDLRDRIWLLERFQSIWDVSPPLQSEEEVVRPTAQNALAPPLNLESKKLSRNVITCAEAAAAKGFELRNELKSIVVQTRMGMVAVHLRGDREVSLRKVKRELGLKEAYLASEEMLARIGLSPGIVSAVKEPLWSMTNLLSASVLELEFVSTNDGTLNGYYVFSPQVLATCPRVIIGDFEELPDQT